MESGCKHVKIISSGNVCELSKREDSCIYRIYCSGTIDDKKKCPEWGPTRAAEKYYSNLAKISKK